uniref:Toll-like receptor 2 n=1 Tax=Latimeria chalumnae TaxID=7897 RepID=H3B5L2_LATCH
IPNVPLVRYIWVVLLLDCVSTGGMQDSSNIVNCSATTGCPASLSKCSFGPETKVLDLSFNCIEKIKSQDFGGLTDLKRLYLQSNRICAIDVNAFSDLSQLEYLDLASNKLQDISTVPLKSLRSLEFLNLIHNTYNEIDFGPETLTGLQNLKSLHVGNTNISVLKANAFKALIDLPLRNVLLITGDLQKYEPLTLKAFNKLRSLTLELNTRRKPELFIDLLKDAANISEKLKVKNIDLLPNKNVSDLFSSLVYSQVVSLTFQNISLNDTSATYLLNSVFGSKIEELALDTIHFNGIGRWNVQISALHQTKLLALSIANVINPNFFRFYSLDYISSLFLHLTKLSLTNTSLFYFPCGVSLALDSLEYLDVSSNLLQEATLFPTECTNAFPSLQNIIINNNKFIDLQVLSLSTLHMKNLVSLVANYNTIKLSSGNSCAWTKSLKYLGLKQNNLSSNVFNCLPDSVQILDLSFNNISVIYNLEQFRSLHEIYLTGNQIFSLSTITGVPALRVLYADNNKIDKIDPRLLNVIGLTELSLSNNPFLCVCEISSVVEFFKNSLINTIDWPEKYRCEFPQSLKGQQISSVEFSVVQCKPGLLAGVIVACVTFLIGLCVLLCIRYKGPWYIRTLWLWIKAKRNPIVDLVQKNLDYHAFISYSERDSLWVSNNLLMQLENNNPPYRICIHERDFKPGKAIITNIIDCISKSYKTIFVLSKNFVQSEWCHYEFFFAHQQTFDEKKDSLILLLLEPIPTNSIPDRFCKLRKLMNKNTYLEWPQDEARQTLFWQRLKAVLDL